MAMEPAKKANDGAFWRRMTLPQEERETRWGGTGYRWFRSENVVCLEHFRRPKQPGQKAGKFGWTYESGN
jgi:hypothetical protein